MELKPSPLADKTPSTPVTDAPAIQGEPGAARLNRRANPALVIGGLLAMSLLIGVGWLLFGSKTSSARRLSEGKLSAAASPIQQKSVAVLPFDNFSAEKDTDYLSDG